MLYLFIRKIERPHYYASLKLLNSGYAYLGISINFPLIFRVFRYSLEEWFSCFTVFARKLVQYVCKVIYNLIDACYRKRCLAISWLIVRSYYVIIENSKELCVA